MPNLPPNDEGEDVISDFGGARAELITDHVELPGWPDIFLYGAAALTDVSDEVRARLRKHLATIEGVLTGPSTHGRRVTLFRPDRETGPVDHEDYFPYEIYAKNLRRAATSAAMFVFVDPPCLGAGEEVHIAASCCTPIVIFQRVDPEEDDCFEPPYFLQVPYDNPNSLRSLSRMVRGISLCPLPSIVRYSNRHDLEQHFQAFWREHGATILNNGLVSLIERRQFWEKASEIIQRRRQILGLHPKQLARAARCYFSLIESIEAEPLVLSALSVGNIERILEPLGYRFEHRDMVDPLRERGALTFGEPPHLTMPLGEDNHDHLKESHGAFIEFCARQRKKYAESEVAPEDQWETLWFEARKRTGLPAVIFEGGRWRSVTSNERPPETVQLSLYTIEQPSPKAQFKSDKRQLDMPTKPGAWERLWKS